MHFITLFVPGEGSQRNVRLMGHKLTLVRLMFCYELAVVDTHPSKLNITKNIVFFAYVPSLYSYWKMLTSDLLIYLEIRK